MTQEQLSSESANLQDWVGRQNLAEDVADSRSAAGLATLLGNRPAASADGPSDQESTLFPLGHWLQFVDDVALDDLGPDGHPKLGGFMPPVPLPRRMWAGSRLEFHAPIRTGQSLQRTTTIESVTEKMGSSGRLCFVVLKHEITADRVPAITDSHTIVYREATPRSAEAPSAARPPRADSPPPQGWDWTESVRPNEIMLFRYSALTFNSHRIHYDHPYVTEVEGYPGLITHGPLTATLLLDAFIGQNLGGEVKRYEFSAHSPLFVNEQIHLVGRRTGEHEHELAAVAPGGKTAISAKVVTGP